MRKSVGIAILSLTALLAGCEQETIRTIIPESVPAEYLIQGVITDANTGDPLSGVSVAGTTTDANGWYSMNASVGANTLKFAKSGYKSVTKVVNVLPIANNEKSVYRADAALIPGSDSPTYKDVKYAIKGSAMAATDNTAVTIKGATAKGLTFTVKDSEFSAESGVKGGTSYLIEVTAQGYNNGYALVTVPEVKAEEGSGDQLVTIPVTVPMQKVGGPLKYYVSGVVMNIEGATVSDADVTIEVAGSDVVIPSVKTNKQGQFLAELPSSIEVTDATVVRVTVEKTGYALTRYAKAQKWANDGQTSTVYFAILLKAASDANVPTEDPSEGGSVEVELPIEAAESVSVEEALADKNLSEEAKEILEALEAKTIIAIPLETPITVKLESQEAVVDANGNTSSTETAPAIDEIVLPAGTVIYFTGGQAQDITIDRIITDEKEVASARVYAGEPSGVVFSQPLEIKFDVQTTAAATDGEPEYSFPLLYEQVDDSWKEEAGNYADYDAKTQQFEGKVNHFSRFRFGYLTAITDSTTKALPDTTVYKQYYTGSESADVIFNAKYIGGVAYDGATPVQAVEKAMSGASKATVNYIVTLLQNLVKSDNANMLPKGYEEMTFGYETTIPSNTQVESFVIKSKETKKTYSVMAVTKDHKSVKISVTVKSILDATMKVNTTQGHGKGHGTAHGNDLNAGGGIFDIE
jgi:hypothetical protein